MVNGIWLDDADRLELLKMSRRRKGSRRLVLRARMVLTCADGFSDREVARQFDVHHQTVAAWRRRFMTDGLAGLCDRVRQGRPPESVERLLEITVSSAPGGGGPWHAELLAQGTGLSPRTIRNVWGKYGLRPREVVCTDLKDGLLVNGEWDVAGCYRGGAGRAVVVAVVGASAWGTEETVVVTGYRREGTGAAAAALDKSATAGTGVSPDSQSLGDFAKFLDTVEAAVPDGCRLQLIVDNPTMHTAALKRHSKTGRPRFRVFSTPSAAAWDDLVGRLVGVMEKRWCNCGVHQRGGHLAGALYRPAPQALISPGIWQPGQNGSACICEEHRVRLMIPWYMSDCGKRQDASRTRKVDCKCNDLRQCRDCCERRYRAVRDLVTHRWHDAFGAGQVIQITLTYRPGFSLRPDGWLRRARGDVQKLRGQWVQDWGHMPPHLMSLEWTRSGLPHCHILVPWEVDPYLETLRKWVWKTWVTLTGGVPDRRTRYRHAAHTNTYAVAERRIAYILKTVQYPQWQVAPRDTPHFHRWYGSYQRQSWSDAPRPRSLLKAR